MSQQVNVSLGGSVVFWSLTQFSNRERLMDGWGGMGLGGFVPDTRSPTAILKSALETVLGGPRVLIRPLEKRDGFAVVEEQRGEDENVYESGLTARLTPEGRINFNRDHPRSGEVLEAYTEHVGRLDSDQVATALVKVMKSLSGIALKKSGGCYYIPADRVSYWVAATEALERASVGGSHACYRINNVMDAQAVRAVRDALRSEVMGEVGTIEADIASLELGRRALDTRVEAAKRLRLKIALYEGILGETLGTLTQAAEQAELAALTGSLMSGVDAPEYAGAA